MSGPAATANRFFFPLTISTSSSGSWSDEADQQQQQKPRPGKTLLQQFVKQNSPKNQHLPEPSSNKTTTKKSKKMMTIKEPTFFLPDVPTSPTKESDKTEPVSSSSDSSEEASRSKNNRGGGDAHHMVVTSCSASSNDDDDQVVIAKASTKAKSGKTPTTVEDKKIGSTMTQSRSGRSGRSLRSHRSTTRSTHNKKMKSSSTHSRTSTKRRKKQRSSSTVELPITTTTAADNSASNNPKMVSAVDEADLPACIQLENDMLLLADGMHLDRNTRMLLASFDAKTVEDFFMMGDVDFNRLLAKARTANRSLPPLQIRKGKQANIRYYT